MTTIKLEIPSSDEIAMFHMGEALRNMAVDYGYVVPSKSNISHSVEVETKSLEISDIVAAVKASLDEAVELGLIGNITDADSIDELADVVRQQASDTTVEVSDTIDADGLPWDQRIHSRGKTRLADNTWRMARKPSEKTDEEWTEYVEGVKTELKALMAIPVAVTYDPNEADPFAIEPPVVDTVVTPPVVIEAPEVVTPHVAIEPPVVDTVVTPPVVIEAPEVVTPPVVIEAPEVVTPPIVDVVVTPPIVDAVVTPPVVDAVIAPPVVDAVIAPPVVDAVIAPPVVDAVVTGPTTFPELMKFITVNNKKLTKESVDEALKAQGLASIALLAARTDLIPQIHAALVKLL